MYRDPSLIRKHPARIWLNDREAALVNALTDYTGQEQGPLLRDIILAHAELVLSGQADIAPPARAIEAAQNALMTAA